MLWIPEFEIGIWNAWIFMVWLIVLQFLPGFLIKEKNVINRLNTSVPMKYEKILNNPITSMAFIIVSFIISIFIPLKFNTIWFYIGLFIFLFGWIFLLMVFYTLRKTKPDKPFTTGPYKYSRHPGYFSLSLICISISIMSLSWVFLIIAIIFTTLLLMYALAEERFCLKTYGKDYQDYMERTSRWIGIPKKRKNS